MVKNFIVIMVVGAILAGCGGGNPTPRGAVRHAAMPVAAGPINDACLASDRTARSRKLCGCIQAVANQTMTGSEQRRAATFYSSPHQAQVVRQSDRASDEHFWKVYRAYGERSEQVCRGG